VAVCVYVCVSVCVCVCTQVVRKDTTKKMYILVLLLVTKICIFISRLEISSSFALKQSFCLTQKSDMFSFQILARIKLPKTLIYFMSAEENLKYGSILKLFTF